MNVRFGRRVGWWPTDPDDRLSMGYLTRLGIGFGVAGAMDRPGSALFEEAATGNAPHGTCRGRLRPGEP